MFGQLQAATLARFTNEALTPVIRLADVIEILAMHEHDQPAGC